MATSYSSNIGLGTPAVNDRNWNVAVDANMALLDVLQPIGGLCVQAKENPSTTLNVKVSAGKYQKADGTVGTYAGTGSQAITTATTKVLYLDDAGTLTVAAAYPSTAHVRLATVVAGATTITSVTDDRVTCQVMGSDSQPYLPLAGGTMTDGANIAVGSTTGTKIGTATTQKIGFYNATPVVQAANTSDLRTLLINVGLLATGGATPLNLNGGALTAASISTGTVTMTDATNIAVGSTTGTKIGTATTQKLGFFNATPVVQPANTTDLRTSLINLGLYASGGASPLDLNGGALTVGSATIADAGNVAVGSTTGTKIGTATTQKIGFYNATPIVQPANTTDLRTALINLGLYASGGASPLNLNGGALTVGSATLADAGNVAVGTTTGTQIGTATTQKLGFYAATPIVQRSGAAQAAVTTTASTQTTPWGYSTQAQADAIVTLVNEVRAALVALGLIKGSA